MRGEICLLSMADIADYKIYKRGDIATFIAVVDILTRVHPSLVGIRQRGAGCQLGYILPIKPVTCKPYA